MVRDGSAELLTMGDDTNARLGARPDTTRIDVPDLDYRPKDPDDYRPGIALIGCGGIAAEHLKAYTAAGYPIPVLCDVDRVAAEALRDQYLPDADVVTDYSDALACSGVEVADIATHPAPRVPIIEAALRAGKHVLSQKPFVLDLDVGERLVALAAAHGVQLAVNQNGRWAPHFAWMRAAIDAGLLGDVASMDVSQQWDHNWVKDTVFNAVPHLLLYDYAIHWFDIACVFFGDRTPLRVTASATRSRSQQAAPSLLAHAVIEFEDGQATLAFNGDCIHGQSDRTTVAGSTGSLHSEGPGILDQSVTLYTAKGHTTPVLQGQWFPDGFHGAMAELLRAIAEKRAPGHSAANNLRSLALCFAAVASAESGTPQVPGTVRRLPGTTG